MPLKRNRSRPIVREDSEEEPVPGMTAVAAPGKEPVRVQAPFADMGPNVLPDNGPSQQTLENQLFPENKPVQEENPVQEKKSVRCPLCRSEYPSDHAVKSHLQSDHPRCGTCKDVFLNIRVIRSHQKLNGHCYCPHCCIYFRTSTLTLRHMRAYEHDTGFTCEQCDRQYLTSEMALEGHCCQCDKGFQSVRSLSRHIRNSKVHKDVEDGSLNHTCSMCPQHFSVQEELVTHIRQDHAPYIVGCPSQSGCEAKFAQPSEFIDHFATDSCISGLTLFRVHQLASSSQGRRLSPGQWVVSLFNESLRRYIKQAIGNRQLPDEDVKVDIEDESGDHSEGDAEEHDVETLKRARFKYEPSTLRENKPNGNGVKRLKRVRFEDS